MVAVEQDFARNDKAKQQLMDIPLDQISPSDYNPRKHFDELELQSLAADIRNIGVFQPIVVRAKGVMHYEIVCGERRWRASKMAGKMTIPAIFRELDDAGAMKIAIIENFQRKDINPIEQAEGFRDLRDRCGLSDNEIASDIGVSVSTIRNYIRVLELPPYVLDYVRDGKTTMTHARALLPWLGYPGILDVLVLWCLDNMSTKLLENLRYAEALNLQAKGLAYELRSAKIDTRDCYGGCDHRRQFSGISFCVNPSCLKDKEAAAPKPEPKSVVEETSGGFIVSAAREEDAAVHPEYAVPDESGIYAPTHDLDFSCEGYTMIVRLADCEDGWRFGCDTAAGTLSASQMIKNISPVYHDQDEAILNGLKYLENWLNHQKECSSTSKALSAIRNEIAMLAEEIDESFSTPGIAEAGSSADNLNTVACNPKGIKQDLGSIKKNFSDARRLYMSRAERIICAVLLQMIPLSTRTKFIRQAEEELHSFSDRRLDLETVNWQGGVGTVQLAQHLDNICLDAGVIAYALALQEADLAKQSANVGTPTIDYLLGRDIPDPIVQAVEAQKTDNNEADSTSARVYADPGDESKTIFVHVGLGGKTYGSFRRRHTNSLQRIKSPDMPMVDSREVAQQNLDFWAEKKGLKCVNTAHSSVATMSHYEIASEDEAVSLDDTLSIQIPPISKTIRVGDSIVPKFHVQDKKELVCDFDTRLREASKKVKVVNDFGDVLLDGGGMIPVGDLDQGWRYFMQPDMVQIGDHIASMNEIGDARLYEVVNKGPNEVRVLPIIDGAYDGAASHPGWNTFARYHYAFVKRVSGAVPAQPSIIDAVNPKPEVSA